MNDEVMGGGMMDSKVFSFDSLLSLWIFNVDDSCMEIDNFADGSMDSE